MITMSTAISWVRPPLPQCNEKPVKLLNGADMNLGDVKEHDIDAFGDASYEYLMTMYASNAGKSGGEFFTPADVSSC